MVEKTFLSKGKMSGYFPVSSRNINSGDNWSFDIKVSNPERDHVTLSILIGWFEELIGKFTSQIFSNLC